MGKLIFKYLLKIVWAKHFVTNKVRPYRGKLKRAIGLMEWKMMCCIHVGIQYRIAKLVEK